MNYLRGALVAISISSAAALSERVIDPFDRHEHDYTLEGPQSSSEIFYVSSNWYDEAGEKHDDRVGDLLLAAGGTSLLGAGILSLREAEQLAQQTA